jgi:hypothetical protein
LFPERIACDIHDGVRLHTREIPRPRLSRQSVDQYGVVYYVPKENVQDWYRNRTVQSRIKEVFQWQKADHNPEKEPL